MEIQFSRKWAMPSAWTFAIKPIDELLHRYVGDGKGWIDPFAGNTSPAQFTNDLNTERAVRWHIDAEQFSKELPKLTGQSLFEGVLFDPPYSLRQLKECYESVGRAVSQGETQKFPQNVKEAITPHIKQGGLAISFGWNSQGFGKNLGFEIVEIMLVAHGRSHNDTIITVERKL